MSAYTTLYSLARGESLSAGFSVSCPVITLGQPLDGSVVQPDIVQAFHTHTSRDETFNTKTIWDNPLGNTKQLYIFTSYMFFF
jgi:hypothetical protein